MVTKKTHTQNTGKSRYTYIKKKNTHQGKTLSIGLKKRQRKTKNIYMYQKNID